MERYPKAGKQSPIVSDTGELAWYYSQRKESLVTVETKNSQALIGFVKDNNRRLKNLSVEVDNTFCSILLTSLDGRPVSRAGRMLLVATARSATSGMTWNDKRTSLSHWGTAPMLVEPVKGQVTLRNLESLQNVEIVPLNGAGQPAGDAMKARYIKGGFTFKIGEPTTPWYLVRVQR
jgi:hypothetical protein